MNVGTKSEVCMGMLGPRKRNPRRVMFRVRSILIYGSAIGFHPLCSVLSTWAVMMAIAASKTSQSPSAKMHEAAVNTDFRREKNTKP